MDITHTNKTKWLILSSFSLIIGVNQLLWLTFATIVISTQTHFGISESRANLLTLIFPIVYVLLSMHSGKILDKQGYKKVVSMAALLMLAGSVIRLVGVNHFWVVFCGQLLIAIAQPYMTNAINQITADWFLPEQINTATGLTIAGLFLGMAIGAFISPPLINSVGFNGMLLVNVVITAVSVLFFLAVVKEKTHAEHHDALTLHSIGALMKNKRLWLIASIVFIAMGYFNGITNWLAPILAPRGIDEAQTGIITALIIVGGILGAIIIPLLSDKWRKRRIFITLAALSGTLLTYPLLKLLGFSGAMLLGFIMGFVLLAGYPLLIASAEQIVHRAQAAKAVAILQLMGNLGGVIVVVLMETVKGITGSWDATIYVLMAIMLIATPLAWRLKDID